MRLFTKVLENFVFISCLDKSVWDFGQYIHALKVRFRMQGTGADGVEMMRKERKWKQDKSLRKDETENV